MVSETIEVTQQLLPTEEAVDEELKKKEALRKRIVFGTSLDGSDATFDLEKLVDTRLLIQANSGGGKSYLIRKILESTFGRVQQIVLDLEGEFGTLAEKFDYLLAGKGLKIPADPRIAETLARKVL